MGGAEQQVGSRTTRSKDNKIEQRGKAPLSRLSQRLIRSDRHGSIFHQALSAFCMSVSQTLVSLRAATPLVVPSLLSCDFAELREEIRRVEQAGARLLHVDIMDGHFVPNLSIGLPVVEAIRRSTRLPLDVHLMISEPDRYLQRFREAGADLLTIHIEATSDPAPLLREIRRLGAGAGISLNPPTPVDAITGYLDLCDLVLVMGVMPGFGGQAFEPVALDKLSRLRALLRPGALLSVDGGVNADTVGPCAEAGADLLVTGSALFSQDNYGRFIDEMTRLARATKEVRV
jgi:ribulose-phosphate 3-epimerase